MSDKREINQDAEIPDEIKEWFFETDLPLPELSKEEPKAAVPDGWQDVAEFCKASFVNDVYESLSEQGLNKSDLAAKLGKTRQWVTRVLNEKSNFEIESMAKISRALGRSLVIRMVGPDLSVSIEPKLPSTAKIIDMDFRLTTASDVSPHGELPDSGVSPDKDYQILSMIPRYGSEGKDAASA